MQTMSEVGGEKISEAGEYESQKGIVLCLRNVMEGKYGDIILLCTVTTAFIMLLAFSAFSASS